MYYTIKVYSTNTHPGVPSYFLINQYVINKNLQVERGGEIPKIEKPITPEACATGI